MIKKLGSINWREVQNQLKWLDIAVIAGCVLYLLVTYMNQQGPDTSFFASMMGILLFPAVGLSVYGLASFIAETRKWWILAVPFVLATIAGLLYAHFVDGWLEFWLLYMNFFFLVPAGALTYYIVRMFQIKWS